MLNVVGLAATLMSLWWTYDQAQKARAAAESAEKAAQRAEREAIASYRRYSIAIVLRCLTEIKSFVASESWPQATLRMADLAEQFLNTGDHGAEGQAIQERIRTWEASFRSKMIGKGRINPTNWDKFLRDLHRLLDPLHSPFTTDTVDQS